MVVPPLRTSGKARALARSNGKASLRARLRKQRRAHVAALPDNTRALLFRRPPEPVLRALPAGGTIGLYSAMPFEAPCDGYASFLFEHGLELALPRLTTRSGPMEFAAHTDPLGKSDLVIGPFGALQPAPDAPMRTPAVIFVPLLGFTSEGERLGQGGGHYDRFLERDPGSLAIGLAWDCQLVDALPVEPHDRALAAVITPTRVYGST